MQGLGVFHNFAMGFVIWNESFDHMSLQNSSQTN